MKKAISLILIVIMLFSFSACGKFDFKNLKNFISDNGDQKAEQTPTFDNVEDLRDYLNSQKDKDVFEIPFYYEGEDLEPEMLAQMVSCFYLIYNKEDGENGLHTVKITEYPGDRMVDAYFSNDRSNLTADEERALDQAIETVTLLKSKAKNSWELELAIHDMLADHITYCDADVEVDDPDSPPRFLTAVGALLDGEANCQGYGDAFYVLASIANFTVSRMNVEAPDGLHLVNTILLDGNWYVVDVTFDDLGDDTPPSYRLFNAGLDQINDITWAPFKEIHKIASVSGNDSYYIRNDLIFYSRNDLAEYVKNSWLAGEDVVRGLLKNCSDGKKIETTLDDKLRKTGASFSYTIWFTEDGKDVYYTIKFD